MYSLEKNYEASHGNTLRIKLETIQSRHFSLQNNNFFLKLKSILIINPKPIL